MSLRTAKRLGASILRDRPGPLLALADGTITSMIRRVMIPIEFAPAHFIKTEFWVLREAANDGLIGSHFMREQYTNICMFPGECAVSIKVGKTRVHIDCTPARASKLRHEVAYCYPAETMVIKP